MRYGVTATKLVERLALLAGRVPVPIFDALVSLVKARALMAAVRFGVFEALRDGALTADALATRCGLNAECTLLLARVLVFAGYVKQRRELFALTRLGRRSLLSGGPVDASAYLRWNYQQWDFFAGFERMLETGQGLDIHSLMHADSWPAYLAGMHDIARVVAPVIARDLPVPRGAQRLLDVAGGHGLFAAAVCNAHPGMTATVLDLPSATAAGRDIATREGFADRVHYRDANALTDALGAADVVLVANFVHHITPSDARALVGRAFAALPTGGTIGLWDAEQPAKNAAADYVDVMTLYFRLTSTSRCYSADEMRVWLSDAGFVDITVRRNLMAPGLVLVSGRKP